MGEAISQRTQDPDPGRGDPARAAAELPIAKEQLINLYVVNPNYAIFTLDTEGRITSWNNGAVRMKGYSVPEAIGMHFSQLYTEEARKRGEPAHNLHVALTEGVFRCESVRRKKNGQTFLADVQITPMFHGGTHIGFSKIVSDVTEHGRLKQDRDESRAQLLALNAEKALRERFVLTLTHDLQNPLASLKSSCELMVKSPGDSKLKSQLAAIALRSVRRMEGMIHDLLDANRIAARERLPIHAERCDLSALLRQTVEDFSIVASPEQVRIDGPSGVTGFWDPGALRRVIENLVSNAIKYGDPSRPITITLRPAAERVGIEVHNFGEPIPPECQTAIFRQFERTRAAEAGTQKGWGIGLTIVKGVVEAHSGRVTVESSAGSGTSFRIELPRDYRNLAH